MRRTGFVLAASLSVMMASAAQAQRTVVTEKAASPPIVDICLTNACSQSGSMKPRSVTEAISAGNVQAVRDLGGSPSQAMDAMMERLRLRSAAGEDFTRMTAGLSQFGDTSDGSTLAFTNHTPPPPNSGPPGVEMVGTIERRAPDGSTQYFYLMDNGGGMWIDPRPGAVPGEGRVRVLPRG